MFSEVLGEKDSLGEDRDRAVRRKEVVDIKGRADENYVDRKRIFAKRIKEKVGEENRRRERKKESLQTKLWTTTEKKKKVKKKHTSK